MANPLLLAAAGVQIAGSIFSFGEARRQRDAMKKAQNAAAVAAAEAKKELSVNYMKGLSIAKEPYELEREALLSQGATLTAAGVGGDQRGAAATAGRVGMLLAQQAKQQRAAMAKEMATFNQAIAKEDASLQTARATVDLGEASGAQAAAQDAMRMRQFNIQQGFSQLGSGLSGLATSGLLEGKKGGGETPDNPFGGFIGGQAPGVGVDLNTFDGYDLSGITANNDTIDFSSMSMFGQPPQLS